MKLTTRMHFNVVTLILTAFLFIAGSAFPTQAAIEIVIQGNPSHMEALVPIIEKFNDEQDDIYVVIIPEESEPEKMIAAYLGHVMPDIIESGGRYTQEYARLGMMASLEDFIAREGQAFIDDIYPASLPDNIVNGQLYSLPAFLQIEGMYYNAEVLDRRGIAPPEQGWTWVDLIDHARRARQIQADGSMATWGIVARSAFQLDYVLIGQAGGRLLDDDGQVMVNSDAVQDTYRWILDAVNEQTLRYRGIHPDAPSEDGWGHHSAFVADATYRQHTWELLGAQMVTAPPLRRDESSSPRTIFSDRSWAIMNNSPEQQAAAWEVIKYLYRPENAAEFVVNLGYFPATRSASQHDYFLEYAAANPNVALWAEQYLLIEGGSVYPPQYGAPIFDRVLPLSTQLLLGNITLPQYIEDAQTHLRTISQEIGELAPIN